MLAISINFIACAWCVLLTLVSAPDVLNQDRANSLDQDEENHRQLQDDFHQISDTFDFTFDHLKDVNELFAYLNTEPEFKDKKFVKFLNGLKSKGFCDQSLRSDLTLLHRILSPLVRPFSSPFIETVLIKYLKPKLDLCKQTLETRLIGIKTAPQLDDIRENKDEIMSSLRGACVGKDKYCYKKLLDVDEFFSVVTRIAGYPLDMKQRVNGIKVSYKFFKIQATCKSLESKKIPGIISLLLEFNYTLDPTLDMVLLTLSICRQLKDREHLHVLRYQEERGEIGNEPVCWAFTGELTGTVKHARTPCPTNARQDHE